MLSSILPSNLSNSYWLWPNMKPETCSLRNVGKKRSKKTTTSRCSSMITTFTILFSIMLFNEMIVDTWQQIQHSALSSPSSPSSSSSSLSSFSATPKQHDEEEIQFNYRQGDRHHIVKRKMKLKGLGLGRKSRPKSKPQPSAPYPKQPSYNPGYPVGSGSHASSSVSGYPKQPAYNPNYNPSHSNPVGPPPPYPGLGSNRPAASGYPGHAPPPYPQQPGYGFGHNPSGHQTFGGSNYGTHSNMGGTNVFGGNQRTPFGGNSYGGNYGGGYRKNKGLGIGRSIGSAGFGALAGTALGAYGGYKLGRMVGGLGRMGHYGYYSDHGRYVRCDPPKTIKVDPETNVSYIPLEEDYDRRCSYFDRPPPPYIEPSMLRSAATMITNSVNVPMIIILLMATITLLFKQQQPKRMIIH